MKKLASIFGGLAFSAFYLGCEPRHSEFTSEGLFWGTIFLVLSLVCKLIADRNTVIVRQPPTIRIVETVLAGGNSYFYLYLRPFFLTNQLPNTNPATIPIQDSLATPRSQDVERLLTDALEAWGTPLIALGKPGEAVGAGRYKTNDKNWETIFEKLALASTAIVMIPSTRSGTMQEAKFLIANGLIEKCVFLYPGARTSESWIEIAETYARFGLILPMELPAYDGAMMKITEDGTVLGTVPLRDLWNENAGTIVQSLARLKKLSSPPTPYQ